MKEKHVFGQVRKLGTKWEKNELELLSEFSL
jgi:hypothetical protein